MKTLIMVAFMLFFAFQVKAQTLFLGNLNKTNVLSTDTVQTRDEVYMAGSFTIDSIVYSVYAIKMYSGATFVSKNTYVPVMAHKKDSILGKPILQYYQEVRQDGDTAKWKYLGTTIFYNSLNRNELKY